MIVFADPGEALVWADFASRVASGLFAAFTPGISSTASIQSTATAIADSFLEEWRERQGKQRCACCGQRTVPR